MKRKDNDYLKELVKVKRKAGAGANVIMIDSPTLEVEVCEYYQYIIMFHCNEQLLWRLSFPSCNLVQDQAIPPPPPNPNNTQRGEKERPPFIYFSFYVCHLLIPNLSCPT